MKRFEFILILAVFFAGCRPEGKKAPAGIWTFSEVGVTFEAHFPRARMNGCEMLGPDEFGAVVRPENLPVNDSPWFAFRVRSETEKTITLRLRCQGGSLRYRPKISLDGTQWLLLPEECYQQTEDRKEAVLKLEIGPRVLHVAAQEPVSRAEMEDWAATLERLPFVTRSTFGTSIKGVPLMRLDIGNAESKRKVVIIGRQHPPETTGSMALMRFIESVVADSEQARSFREAFHLVVMPLLNPDGVDAGHWRHNMGHMDLNRDWNAFAQPETRAVREQILALKEQGRLFLMLDFHSTFRDVFYTQPDEAASSPPNFTVRWLAGIRRRVPGYTAERSASPTPTPTTSTYWAHHTFGIPAITYEIGDNTDRTLLKRVAHAAAEEMMELLVEMKDEK
jgi:predicted deacylase